MRKKFISTLIWATGTILTFIFGGIHFLFISFVLTIIIGNIELFD